MRLRGWGAGLAVAAAILTAACGSSPDERYFSPPSSAAPSPSSLGSEPAPGPGAAASAARSPSVQTPQAAPAAGAGTNCGTVTSTIGTRLDVYVHYGSVPCTTAITIFTRYYTDPTVTREGSGANATIDGWQCLSTSLGMQNDIGYVTGCSQPGTLNHIVTVEQGSGPPPREWKSQLFEVNGAIRFQSPTGRWFCGFANGQAPSAGCTGGMPHNAPGVPNYEDPTRFDAPNGIEIIKGQPGHFIVSGDIGYLDQTAQVLPYGESLSVDGITCQVDPTTGVTCTDGTHGFTVSTSGYRLF